jgi:pimeloyl-ACP methyl ester carboxylesterase
MKEEIVKLSDGTNMCYAEFGKPDGIPVMLLHGNPGVRFSWGLYPNFPYLDNIRIIAPDRPGYGKTDFKKNALQKWPNDILELLNHLGIDKIHLFAPSGGGPYALACAWKIPYKLLSVGLFGSVGPYNEEYIAGVNKPLRILWRLANPLFGVVKLQNRIMAKMAMKDPVKLARSFSDLELSETDKKIAVKPEIQTLFETVFPESYLQNGIGSAYDVTVPKNWTIPLHEIKMKITAWQAEEDCLTGKMQEYISTQLPNCEFIEIPNSGHLWIMENVATVLKHQIGTRKPAEHTIEMS